MGRLHERISGNLRIEVEFHRVGRLLRTGRLPGAVDLLHDEVRAPDAQPLALQLLDELDHKPPHVLVDRRAMSERDLRRPVHVTVWGENVHERTEDDVRARYPHGMHATIADGTIEAILLGRFGRSECLS